MALTLADLWSRQNGSPSAPSTSPAASLAAWSVTAEVKVTSSPCARAPFSMASRQSVWISPER
jgi:hypothetical protein